MKFGVAEKFSFGGVLVRKKKMLEPRALGLAKTARIRADSRQGRIGPARLCYEAARIGSAKGRLGSAVYGAARLGTPLH